MIQRPLCTAAVVFLVLQAVLTAGGFLRREEVPPALEAASDGGEEVTVQGTVARWEERPDYRLLYLEDCRIELKGQSENSLNGGDSTSNNSNQNHLTSNNSNSNASGNNHSNINDPNSYDSNSNDSNINNPNSNDSNGYNSNRGFQNGDKPASVIEGQKLLIYMGHGEGVSENPEGAGPACGNRIQVRGEISVFEEARNPGNFDQKLYYEKQGISASMWTENYTVLGQKEAWLGEHLAQLRRSWKELLVRHLGDKAGNSMSAILLGDKSELDQDVKKLFSKCGIGHILAISGLHMSFLGMGLYGLLRKAGCPYWMSGILGTLFLAAYTVMIGSGVSSVRAFTMFALRVGADICGRCYDMPTSLAVAAAVLAAGQPLYLTDAGYLLSFGAVLGMVTVSPVLQKLLTGDQEKSEGSNEGRNKRGNERRNEQRNEQGYEQNGMQNRIRKVKSELGKGLCGSLAVNFMLLPVMLYFYYEFPPYSIVLNLFIIPMMSLVLGAGITGSVLCLVWDLGGGLVLWISKAVLWLYEGSCDLTLRLPFSRIMVGQPGKLWIAGYYAVLLCFCLFLKYIWRKEWRKQRALAAVSAACVLCGASLGMRNRGVLQVTMLDVGQGDGIFIRSPGGMTCFVDGGSTDVSGVGQYRIEPFLGSQGVRTLDYVFLSHGDADHTNGILELLEDQKLGIRIRNLVLPPLRVQDEALLRAAGTAASQGTRVLSMEAGQQITRSGDEGFSIRCLAPSKAYQGETGNAASMVLSLECGQLNMLLTGDLEEAGERSLLESLETTEEEYQILKVAHHGSKNSTQTEFLERIRPAYAWISAGVENRYGHPAEETLKRLEAFGCRIYNTQKDGAVTLRKKGEKAVIVTVCKS